MAGFGGFRPAAFRFLRDLARTNEKAWFEANRDVYEREVREPMRLLVETLDAKLGSIAPEIVGDPKRSMFRIKTIIPRLEETGETRARVVVGDDHAPFVRDRASFKRRDAASNDRAEGEREEGQQHRHQCRL